MYIWKLNVNLANKSPHEMMYRMSEVKIPQRRSHDYRVIRVERRTVQF